MRKGFQPYNLAFVALVLALTIPPQNFALQDQTKTSKPKTPASETLEIRKAIDKSISAGQTHFYDYQAVGGEYVHIEVEQRGIDVVITLVGPSGDSLAEMNNRYIDGQEPLSFVASMKGSYRVDVKASESGTSGHYTIMLLEVRRPQASDLIRIEAERDTAEGQRLRLAGKPEAYRSTLEHYEVALKKWREIGDRYWEASTLANIGVVYNVLDEKQKALDAFRSALSLTKEIKDAPGEWRILNSIGYPFDSLGQRKTALDYYQQALTIARSLADRRGAATP